MQFNITILFICQIFIDFAKTKNRQILFINLIYFEIMLRTEDCAVPVILLQYGNLFFKIMLEMYSMYFTTYILHINRSYIILYIDFQFNFFVKIQQIVCFKI